MTTTRIIICPRCLSHSPHLGDITDGYCGICRARTDGRVLELEPDEYDSLLVPVQRAASLYAIELHVARALRLDVDLNDVTAAFSAGVHTAGPKPGTCT